ncbi:lysosomal acid glucosylceramidase-like [Teleopsis dalmanni]|uniref:lysosomal acid glucosylceramidase-like n=1 Tax=Teleopsis dalmanni TaxID=139649 RepID=UPI0018CEB555|nr:lysosomal acid glucosylceramidase-like [Teleopsis dalmanni]
MYFSLFCLGLTVSTTKPCKLRETNFGSVCVCTAEYCDYLENPKSEQPNQLNIISSSKSGLRFEETQGTFNTTEILKIIDFRSQSKSLENDYEYAAFDSIALVIDNFKGTVQLKTGSNTNSSGKTFKMRMSTIEVNRDKKYQKVSGFGGALTGTVSYLIQKLNTELQDHMYRSYFAESGIGYNMLRTSIGGCDFDLEPWAYNEQPENDKNLSNFTKLDKRDEQKIEQIKRLKTISGFHDIKIMAAAWSPPKWMKSNNNWTGFSYLLPEFYQTWANYHLKFIELMHAKNLTIWAISTGNEPLNGVIGWFFVHFMSLGWTPSNQAIWLNDYLGPTIRNSNHKNVLIFGNDDQRYTYPAWFQKMKTSRPDSLNYLDGFAVHWYWDDIFAPYLIDEVHNAMPEKLLLNTEACVGDKPWQTHGPELGSWSRAEQYIRDILQDLQHNFNGWIDWNLILDENGGPNYVQNHVDAPIIVNTKNPTEFYKQPIFYAIGHFSKFLAEGSVRIETTSTNIKVDVVGFQRPDGTLAIILFNSDRDAVDLLLNDNVRGKVWIRVPPNSVHTIIYK